MFKFYFVCSLIAMILRQNHPDWTLLAKEGLVLKETWIYLKILWRFYKDFILKQNVYSKSVVV